MRYSTIHIIFIILLLFSASSFASAMKRVQSRMKHIPGGTFQMGQDKSKINQRPVHPVTVSSFYMDSTEVTQKDFISVMSAQPFVFDTIGLSDENGLGDEYPMYNICWYDMVLYCNAISKEEGFDTMYTYDSLSDTIGINGVLHGTSIDYNKTGYRLPTEAEWEYACRAGTTTEFFWGDEPADLYAWFMDNSDRKTQPVGTKAPNNWGLYDLCGNVYDFCNDWYARYDSIAQIDPHGPDTGSLRTARGGNMIYDSTRMRSAERMSIEPDVHYLYYGFRCVFPDTTGTIGISTTSSPIRLSSHSTPQSHLIHSSQVALESFSDKTRSLMIYTLNGKMISHIGNKPELIKAAMKKTGHGIFIIHEVW